MNTPNFLDKIFDISYINTVKKYFTNWKEKREELPTITKDSKASIFIATKNLRTYEQVEGEVIIVEYKLNPERNHAYILINNKQEIKIDYYLYTKHNTIAIIDI